MQLTKEECREAKHRFFTEDVWFKMQPRKAAKALKVSLRTISKWRKEYRELRGIDNTWLRPPSKKRDRTNDRPPFTKVQRFAMRMISHWPRNPGIDAHLEYLREL